MTLTVPPNKILLSPPHMSGAELAAIGEAFDSNFIAPVGPMVDRFEAAFREVSGFDHCLALSSGTAAIHLALRHLGVGPGDCVLASTLTFIGSVAPVAYQGARPVFIDCDESWTMDPGLLEQAIGDLTEQGRKPRAILPTDLYGQPCDVAAIQAIGERHSIPVIMDSAEAVGALVGTDHAGRGAWAAAYSFNGNKIITTSGGGILATDDPDLAGRARYLSQQAREPVAHYEHETVGYNYRLSNICAAIGVGQLTVLADRVAAKRAVFARYADALGDLPGVSFMPEQAGTTANRWLSVMLIDPAVAGIGPFEVRQALEAMDIEARPVWKPMHCQPVFRGETVYGGAVAQDYFDRGLCLPSGTALSAAEQDRVIDAIRGCFGRAGS